MHRKLPHGGILVFLTGKQEIVRMVNKLRRALKSGKQSGNSRFTGANDVSVPNIDSQNGSGPREIDDEEVDGENADVDDYDEIDNDDDDDIEATEAADGESDEAIPSNAYILPLYSMLSAEEQAKIFAPVPEDSRLIVIATNIAETSITIPGMSYVVDTGRQKCRNYNSGTGIASYDIMWISRAAADQRAGRAGRTGPGHCYRLYSSSLYSRHMDAFALPEVLTRPLEDVVLAMKALKISQVANFPFPTPPDRGQIDSAVKLLANIGCVDLSRVEEDGGDGVVTKLGEAVAKLPLGVRYGKILLVAANAGVLDYAIAMVSVLSGNTPFMHNGERDEFKVEEDKEDDDSESLDEIDQNKLEQLEKGKKKQRRWSHKCGDALAGMLAVGGYTYVGRGAGGASEQAACRKFCEENSLNYVVMTRIQKMRAHLSRLAHVRMSSAEGVAAKTGGFVSSMPPPSKLQENLLVQAIASGLLDNIALLAPPGSVSGEHPFSLRTAYLSCSTSIKEPLFMDRNSVVFSRDSRQLPQWICCDSIVRKTAKDGTAVSMMKNITPIDPSWIGTLAKGSRLLALGAPLSSPPPAYDEQKDAIMVAVSTKFGSQRWEIPSVKQVMYDALQLPEAKHSADFMMDDSFRWFARFLLEGRIIEELKGLKEMLSDSPTIITRKTPVAKVSLLVSALSSAGVDSAAALRKHWAEQDNKFLFKCLKNWIRRDCQADAKKLWIEAVKQSVSLWKEG
jgi:ATP-dependent RNA helicase DHX37/DHR1